MLASGDGFGSLTAVRCDYLCVRSVPFAASQAANLSVSYVGTRRSELID